MFFWLGIISAEAITSAMNEIWGKMHTFPVHKIAHRVCINVRINVVRYGFPCSVNTGNLEDTYNSSFLCSVTISSNDVLRKGSIRRIKRTISSCRETHDIVFGVWLQLGYCNYCTIYKSMRKAESTNYKFSFLSHCAFKVNFIQRSFCIAPNRNFFRNVHSDLNRYWGDGNYLNSNLLPRCIWFCWHKDLFFLNGNISLR